MAAWELRIAEFRVFYNVEEQVQIVEIKGIGEKEGYTFLFRSRRMYDDKMELSSFSRR